MLLTQTQSDLKIAVTGKGMSLLTCKEILLAGAKQGKQKRRLFLLSKLDIQLIYVKVSENGGQRVISGYITFEGSLLLPQLDHRLHFLHFFNAVTVTSFLLCRQSANWYLVIDVFRRYLTLSDYVV